MRKSGLFLLVSLMLLFSVSCSDESSYSIDNLDVVEFSKLGEAQLKGIKEITGKIDQAKESLARLSVEELISVAKDASIDYIESQNFDYTTEQEVIQLILNIYDNPIDFETVVNSMTNSRHRDYMYQIRNAIESSVNPEAAVSQLNAIEESANLNLPNEEAFLIVGATTSDKYQIDYWYNYLGGYNASGKTTCVTSWNSVGKAAIAGAAGGAASCGAARFLGPVGWKAWGACILGGAAGAAVYEAVFQCLK